MTDMTLREVVEVVQRLVGNARTMAGLSGDPIMRQNLRDGERALATLSALADRAGDDVEVALAQAVEFAEYVEQHAKGKMESAARHFLSLPYAQALKARILPPAAPGASHE